MPQDSLFHIPKSGRAVGLYVFFMLAMATAAFENLRTHDFFDGWDDLPRMRETAAAAQDLSAMFAPDRLLPVRPPIDFLLVIAYWIWGENLILFRALQVCLHIIACFLLLIVFKKLGADVELSLIAAAFFLVCPAHFRAIHWFSTIHYEVALIWGLLSIVAYLNAEQNNRTYWVFLSTLALIASIFSHPSAASIALFCAYLSWWRTQSISKTLLNAYPLLIAAILCALLSHAISPNSVQSHGFFAEVNGQRIIANFLWYLGRLATTTLWLTKETTTNDIHPYEIVIGIGFICAAILLYRQRLPLALHGVIWVLIAILPFVNTLPYRLAFGPSRHLYFASIGTSLLLALCLRTVICTLSIPIAIKRYTFVITCLAVCFTGILSLRKAEALSIYFSARGYAFAINSNADNARLAADLFVRAIQHSPDILPFDVYTRFAAVSFSIGESHANLLNDTAKRFPKNPTILMLQGVTAFLEPDTTRHQTGKKQISQAIAQASDKKKLRSDTALMFHNLGGYYFGLSQYEKAIECYKHALFYNADYPNAWINLSKALHQFSRTEEAIEAIYQVVAHNPEDQEATQLLTYMLNLPFEQERYADAEKIYVHYLTLDKKNAFVLHNLGLAQQKQKKYNAAIQTFQNALEITPNDIDIQLRLAETYYLNNDPAAALNTYHTLLVNHPTNVAALQNLSVLLIDQNRIEEAIATVQKALVQDNTNADLWHLLGQTHQAQGDLIAVHETLLKAIEHAPENTAYLTAYLNLGAIFHQRGHIERARIIYEDIVQQAPHLPDTYLNLGILDYSEGHYQAAVVNFKLAIQHVPDDPKAHLGLAQAFEKTDNLQQAIQSYLRILELDPHNQIAQNRLKALQ